MSKIGTRSASAHIFPVKRNPKICQQDILAFHQNVFWFHIAVADFGLLEVLKAVTETSKEGA